MGPTETTCLFPLIPPEHRWDRLSDQQQQDLSFLLRQLEAYQPAEEIQWFNKAIHSLYPITVRDVSYLLAGMTGLSSEGLDRLTPFIADLVYVFKEYRESNPPGMSEVARFGVDAFTLVLFYLKIKIGVRPIPIESIPDVVPERSDQAIPISTEQLFVIEV